MNTKKAFTLGEVLVVFVITGIIATIGITTVKPWEKAYKYSYTKVFNALEVSIYNYMTTVSGMESFPQSAQTFCNALISYMNTADNAINDADNSCNKSEDQDAFLGDAPTLDDFRGMNPKIKLSNGAWLWIGANGDNKSFSYTQDMGSYSETVKYYIVYADLNGDRGPNSIAVNEAGHISKFPDIVAFIVTDSLAVIPVGYPKVDQRYLSAHIMFPVSEEDDEASAEGDRPSGSMTYYEAIVGAYGKECAEEGAEEDAENCEGTGKIVTSGVVQTYDIEKSLPNDNLFKLVDNLDSYYVTAPTFNQDICGDGKTAAQLIEDDLDSHCSVKVFNYN